jgi:hypothetical protein
MDHRRLNLTLSASRSTGFPARGPMAVVSPGWRRAGLFSTEWQLLSAAGLGASVAWLGLLHAPIFGIVVSAFGTARCSSRD